jgi:hypothetical protein
MRSRLIRAGLVMGLLLALVSSSVRAQPATTQPVELTGQLLTPTGEPAVGAQIVLATPGQVIFVSDVRIEDASPENDLTITDKTGFFRFANPPATFRLLARHQEGWLELFDDALPDDGVLHLNKWARLEGTWAGELPKLDWPNIYVALASGDDGDEQCHLRIRFQTSTDKDGRFVVERVWPGVVSVTGMVPIGEGGSGPGVTTAVQLKSGQTTTALLPALPAKISGKLVMPAGTAFNPNEQFAMGQLRETADGGPPVPPLDASILERKDRSTRQAIERLKQTPEWKAYEQKRIDYYARPRSWSVMLDPKAGTFTTFAAPDGQYTLTGQIVSTTFPPTSTAIIAGSRTITLKNGQFDPPEDAVLTLTRSETTGK